MNVRWPIEAAPSVEHSDDKWITQALISIVLLLLGVSFGGLLGDIIANDSKLQYIYPHAPKSIFFLTSAFFAFKAVKKWRSWPTANVDDYDKKTLTRVLEVVQEQNIEIPSKVIDALGSATSNAGMKMAVKSLNEELVAVNKARTEERYRRNLENLIARTQAK